MSLEILDIWVGCSKLKSIYCQCVQHGSPRPVAFIWPWLMARDVLSIARHTHTLTYIVSQIVPILTVLDGHRSIQFYSLPHTKKIWSWPFKLISWPTKLISQPTNVSWPTIWKTVAWPHSSFPSLPQKLGKWDVNVEKNEIEINIRRKVGGMPKKKQDKRKNGHEMKQRRKDGKWETAFQKAHFRRADYVCVTI